MTTLSPISSAIALANRPAVTPPATLSPATDVTGVRPSSVVSLGNVTLDLLAQTYSRNGQLPGHGPINAWESDSYDAVTKAINTNFYALPRGTGFSGLGATLIEQFAKGGTDISQSALSTTSSKPQSPTELKVQQALLHTQADNLVSLTVKTASGKTVTFSLASQAGGLAAQAKVDGGTLSAAELKEIAKLGEAFQGAVDGMSAQPPKLDLGKLTQFDSSVLSSVDLSGKLKVGNADNLTLAFHADSQSRSTRMSSPAGEVNLSVDLKNAGILGNAKQQAIALKSYLAQFDKAQARGKADADLMAMFKDAFTAMNSNYPQGVKAPAALTRSTADQGLLTGLADFKASITQAAKSTNPARLSETDTFAYEVAQKTRVGGNDISNRTIDQSQQSKLKASFHLGLNGGKAPALDTRRESQNYLYKQVDDKASSSANITYKDGFLTNASVDQSASQNTRTQRYEMGMLVKDTVVPNQASSHRDYLVLLEYAAREGEKAQGADETILKDALANMHQWVLLQDDPSALPG
ncbi:lactate dehydrogenase [Pseudomonas sp. Bout1]|uniref:lactate dehydrogenase n=1 Tax=Pseudomonas sp. Bout1 TaxID=3048600 RepID=UPI002AB3C570|nr:lactate dehydrogenase [Pseudomonas sp. Bout1]MDY7531263.1 lactate dehydrogenase [Pseudomonas sp. Bout1]MEB0183128.1 lactate dehydrogenase [Pseudomonas sp. Bout1]